MTMQIGSDGKRTTILQIQRPNSNINTPKPNSEKPASHCEEGANFLEEAIETVVTLF